MNRNVGYFEANILAK